MNIQKISYTLSNIQKVVLLIAEQMEHSSVFCLYGDLGAGKTTLVKKLLAACGVTEVITSPTFTYVNVYKNNQGQTFYHFDLYRIGSVDEFIALGFDEYINQPNSWAFIEWPEHIISLLPDNTCILTIEHERDLKSRTMVIGSDS